MSTTLLWHAFSDATCTSFNLYRAITGIRVLFPNSLQIGDQLIFSATSRTIQTITMSGTTAASLVSDVNTQAKGLKATLSNDGFSVFLRVTATKDPRFQLYPCSFATDTLQAPRIILPRQEYALVTSVAFVPATFDYSYTDLDGDPLDWYKVTTVLSSVESVPTVEGQALPNPTDFCVITGRVTDLQARAIAQSSVFVKVYPEVQNADNSGITKQGLEVKTDAYGRFSIPLLQNKTVLLRIPAIGYNQVVQVPAQTYVLYQDLVAVNDQLFLEDHSSLEPPSGP